jgi:hypothetical protein
LASRVRSAAQGYVELDGVGMLPPGSTNRSPLTGTPCTWFRRRALLGLSGFVLGSAALAWMLTLV